MDSYFSHQNVTLFCLSIAVFRIYLEVIAFDFNKLPLTAKMAPAKAHQVHKMGFYFSVGYFILFAPSYF